MRSCLKSKRKTWWIVPTDAGTFHIAPSGDERVHTASFGCWCNPMMDADLWNGWCVHVALDGQQRQTRQDRRDRVQPERAGREAGPSRSWY